MRIVFIGGPGSGKGTQSEKIIDEYKIAHISTGDILRSNVKNGTELGKKAKTYMDAGELVPDDLIIELIKERIKEDDCNNGFLMDGFPRSENQAVALDKMLEELGIKLDNVVLLDVTNEELKKRLLGRGRADDNEETISNRLDVYEKNTKPVLDYYDKKGMLKKVQGEGSIDDIYSRIKKIL